MSIKSGRYGFLGALGLVLVLGGLAFLATPNSLAVTGGQAAKPPVKEEVIFPHMDRAVGYLKAADQQLKEGEPIFYGHRGSAMKHTEDALADLQKGIDEYMAHHPGTPRNEFVPEAPPSEAGDKYPKMQGALWLLQHAQAELEQSAHIYYGQRGIGLEQTKAAINEIQIGMKEAAAHGNK